MGTDVGDVTNTDVRPESQCLWCMHDAEDHYADEFHCLATGHGQGACRCWAFLAGPELDPQGRYRVETLSHRQCADCYGR